MWCGYTANTHTSTPHKHPHKHPLINSFYHKTKVYKPKTINKLKQTLRKRKNKIDNNNQNI